MEKEGDARRAEGKERNLQRQVWGPEATRAQPVPWCDFPQMCHSWHSLIHIPLSPSAAIEALKKAHREEMNKELGRTRSFQQCSSVSDALQKQHQ